MILKFWFFIKKLFRNKKYKNVTICKECIFYLNVGVTNMWYHRRCTAITNKKEEGSRYPNCREMGNDGNCRYFMERHYTGALPSLREQNSYLLEKTLCKTCKHCSSIRGARITDSIWTVCYETPIDIKFNYETGKHSKQEYEYCVHIKHENKCDKYERGFI
jgi:hypothetical protein